MRPAGHSPFLPVSLRIRQGRAPAQHHSLGEVRRHVTRTTVGQAFSPTRLRLRQLEGCRRSTKIRTLGEAVAVGVESPTYEHSPSSLRSAGTTDDIRLEVAEQSIVASESLESFPLRVKSDATARTGEDRRSRLTRFRRADYNWGAIQAGSCGGLSEHVARVVSGPGSRRTSRTRAQPRSIRTRRRQPAVRARRHAKEHRLWPRLDENAPDRGPRDQRRQPDAGRDRQGRRASNGSRTGVESRDLRGRDLEPRLWQKSAGPQ